MVDAVPPCLTSDLTARRWHRPALCSRPARLAAGERSFAARLCAHVTERGHGKRVAVEVSFSRALGVARSPPHFEAWGSGVGFRCPRPDGAHCSVGAVQLTTEPDPSSSSWAFRCRRAVPCPLECRNSSRTARGYLGKGGRPQWFWQKEKFGGIFTDIGSHQIEQFLIYTGATDGTVNFARVDNFANPDAPTFEDFGEVSFTMSNGALCYCRLDWFNPKGLRTWGDGRTFILGTDGYIEVRKYIEITSEPMESQVLYWVDHTGKKRVPCAASER
jgi:hypothetical protein